MPYTNIQKRNEFSLKWQKDNKDKVYDHKAKRRARNKQFVQSYKLEHGCSICGYNKCAEALEFDHIDRSTKNGINDSVSKLSGHGSSIETIKIAINKCNLLCANCHREKTIKNKDYNKKDI